MKTIISTLVLLTFIMNMNAQNFGVRVGANFATAKADFDGISISDNETGFYLGAYGELKVLENLKIRSEINYIYVKDLDQLQFPLLAKFAVSDKFNILAGPSFTFLQDAGEDEKSFNFGIDFGLSYNIWNKFDLEARYSVGLSNLAEDNYYDAKIKLHGLFVGVAYNIQ
ncbi:porin family protein [Aestuariibaculum sp. M13]|uniref:porin family protein n=1 Tax=Aestuariibaculum sp. M13 TaxID=2967132 RepID=UPI002159D929|nr:porin family protein [Aestuariibaculum sp. M13]MCR8669203.1 porin family protein [Aestuariibaculum sp. M13]